MTKPLPAVFIGHGNPVNVVRHNRWTEGWKAIGASMPRPRAILVVSAHWYVEATMVTAMEGPRTIHDFGGFPEELYKIVYPAPGDPALAGKVRELLGPSRVGLDQKWGLDHGAWSVLSHMFPEADIPVVELSMDWRQPPFFHYEMGKLLEPLRSEGVLLLGSGNIVHNLGPYEWDLLDTGAFEWAWRFEDKVRTLLLAGEDAPLVDYETMGPEARLAVPAPNHYLPLLYVLGSRAAGEQASFPVEGFDGGSMSMLCVQLS